MKAILKIMAVTTIAITLLCCKLNAQGTFTSDTSFITQNNVVFQNLDKSRVPNGILLDYGMEFTNLSAFDGTVLVDSTKTAYGTLLDIYNTIATSIIHTNAGSFVHPIYYDSLYQTLRQPGVITLGGLFYQYARLADNAVTGGLITVTNNQLFDKFVGGVWQNPYITKNVFAFSPSINNYNTNGTLSMNVTLPSSLWLTNAASQVSSITADFGDGIGFRALTQNQLLTVSYSLGGTKTWTFKLTLTGGTVLQSQTDIKLDSGGVLVKNKLKGPGSSLCNTTGSLYLPNGFTGPTVPITADIAIYNQKASGFMTIHYANSDGVLHNPLIVAEGFDAGDILTPEQLTGLTDINSFMNQIKSNTGSANLRNLLTDNLLAQYDIVYVDWKHSADFIERNALLLEKVIATVNAQSGNAPIVVLGQSMGGVVARYALKDMENRAVAHHARMFISWDAPQQGANVPIAYQYASRQARDLYLRSNIPGIFNAYNNYIRPVANGFVLLYNTLRGLFNGSPWQDLQTTNLGDIAIRALSLQDAPSAREMLINYVNRSLVIDNSIHQAWQSSLTTLGYPNPVNCRNVAVSNGSECAAAETFLPGQALFDIRGNANTRFLGDLLGTLGLPLVGAVLNQPALYLSILPGKNTFNIQFTCDAQPDAVAAQQYIGKITYTKKFLWLFNITTTITNWSLISNPSIQPYDYYPGGEYQLPFDPGSSSYQSALLKFNVQVLANQQSFCFIPSTSALDIGSGSVALTKADNLIRYIGAFPPAAPKNTPFAFYTTAFSTQANNNEGHIQISLRNGDWVANMLNNVLNQPSNCSFLCPNASMAISGPATVCSGAPQVFTLTGITASPNLNISWTSNPANGATIAANGLQATVSAGVSGLVTITATVTSNGGSCNGALSAQKQIRVGGLSSGDYPITGPSSACRNQGVTFSAPVIPGAINYAWFWPGNWTNNGGQGTPTLNLTTASAAGSGQVGVRVANACDAGGSPAIKFVIINACGFSFTISPNPGTSISTISTLQTAAAKLSTAGATTMATKIYKIKVTDQLGNIRKQFSYPAGVTSVDINFGDLIAGIYTIMAFDGNSWGYQLYIKQ